MWALVESNSVTRVYTRPTAITVGDINYPQNIMSMWTASELEAIGIYEVVSDGTNLKDSSYYYNGVESFTFASGVVTRSYGVATEKNLDDTGSGDSLIEGLKTQKKHSVNNSAGGKLKVSDWYVLRATEGGTATPSATTTHRAAVRTKSNEMCTLIDNAANVDALAALYVWNEDDPPTRPLGEFPLL